LVLLTDPLEVPVGCWMVAERLGIEDPSCVSATWCGKTRLDHVWNQAAYGLRNFAEHEAELAGKVFARAWNTGDGPTAIFHYAVRWLRENDILLPGLTTLTRLVAHTRDEATGRLYETLARLPTATQGQALDLLLEVPEGERVSTLERWRTGPTRASGPGMVKALDLAAEVAGAGFATLDLHAVVPARRVVELGKYGMAARSAQLKKHLPARRRATLLATVQRLETKTVDDALELLDLLMVTELSGRARREADKQTVRRHPRLAKASARLAAAVEVMLEAVDWGAEDEVLLAQVWEAIEAVVPRADLRAAVATVTGMVAPPDAEDDGGWRVEMAAKYQMVSGMVKMLTDVITFGANAEGEPVLAAMAALPQVLAYRSHTHSVTVLPRRLIDPEVVTGPWKRLVYGHPPRTDDLVDRNGYVFCVLEQFHRHLKRREIFAMASSRWRDPNAQLLEGAAWEAVKDSVMTDLGLDENPDALLAAHVRDLDTAYRTVLGRLAANTDVRIDNDGRIHVASGREQQRNGQWR
jgi:hypothetical protein